MVIVALSETIEIDDIFAVVDNAHYQLDVLNLELVDIGSLEGAIPQKTKYVAGAIVPNENYVEPVPLTMPKTQEELIAEAIDNYTMELITEGVI